MDLRLHEKQGLAFQSSATEIMYGGAAGGGKSHLMRVAAIAWCVAIPGLQVYLFRRTNPDLFKNHMLGAGSFPELLGELVARGVCRIVYSPTVRIIFANGAAINLCHCQYEHDVYDYQGAEIHVLMVDELTQWAAPMYRFLRSRVRIGGLAVPERFRGSFPRILTGANPGGIGHNWVKAMFVSAAAPLTITEMPATEGGLRRQFIPARLEDNPTLTENDPGYEQRLEGLGSPALVRAMRQGDWDIVEGGFFDDLWRTNIHAIPPFKIPPSWRIDRSFDWGSSKPFSVGWWAEADGTEATRAVYDANGRQTGTFRWAPPRGTLVRVAEWYGCKDGEPNVGLRLSATEIAREIVRREQVWRDRLGWSVYPGPADSAIYTPDDDNVSIGDKMAQLGVRWVEADKSPNSRKNGWELMRAMLKAALWPDPHRPGQWVAHPYPEEPGLFVFNTCTHFLRTVPVLPRDPVKTDDVDTKAEDHIGDETRYRVLVKRAAPFQTTSFTR